MRRPILILLLVLATTLSAHAERLVLPFEGRWFVAQGGDTPNANHHMAVRAQWYGVDFAKTGGPHGRSLASVPKPSRVEQFHGWNAPVLAPASGTVVTVVDRLPDNPPGARDPDNPAGNHVVIRTPGPAYIFLAHLRHESITVREGERVAAGQPLGRVGNSGNSDYPHLHLHVQDRPGPDQGRGLNPVFEHMNVELNGKTFRDVAWPVVRGLFVEPR